MVYGFGCRDMWQADDYLTAATVVCRRSFRIAVALRYPAPRRDEWLRCALDVPRNVIFFRYPERRKPRYATSLRFNVMRRLAAIL